MQFAVDLLATIMYDTMEFSQRKQAFGGPTYEAGKILDNEQFNRVIKVRIKEGIPIAVILSKAKNLSYEVTLAGEILRFAQNDRNVTRLIIPTS